MKKKLLALLTAAIMLLAAIPAYAEDEVKNLSVLDGVSALDFTEINGLKASNSEGLGSTVGFGWAKFDNVDFGKGGLSGFYAMIATVDEHAGYDVNFYIDSLDNDPFATITVRSTGGWTNHAAQEADLHDGDIYGKHTVYLTIPKNGAANLLKFGARVEGNDSPSYLQSVIDAGKTKQFGILTALDIIEYNEGDVFDVEAEVSAMEFIKAALMLTGDNSDDKAGAMLSKIGLNSTEIINAEKACEVIMWLLNRQDTVVDNMTNYESAAQLGIKTQAQPDRGLKWADAIDLLLNATEVAPATLKSVYREDDVLKGVYTAKVNSTLLTEYRDIHKSKGIVTMDSVTALTGPSDITENEVVIGEYVFDIGECDVDGLLGYAVEYYYQANDFGNTLLYIEKTKHNSTVELKSYDVEEFDVDSIRYYGESGEKTVRFTKDICMIYNGVAVSKYSKDMLSFKSGSVELISNNNDDIPDVIKLWSTTDKIFSGYSDGILYFKNTTFTIDLNDANVRYNLMNGGGIEMLPEKITNDSICSVAEVQSIDGSYTYYNIWVRKKIVSGYIKSLSLSDAEITIGEQELKLSKEFAEAGANGIFVGMEVMAYVNAHNEVAYTKSNSVSNQLGYIIRTYPDENDETTYVKIFDESGNISDYRVYEKIEIDGIRCNEITAKSAIDSQLAVDRLCVFTTNNIGEIRKINFAKANNSTNAAELNNGLFKVGAVPTTVYKSVPRTLNSGKVVLSADFILFKIPSDLNDYRLYEISKNKFSNDSSVANLTVYNRDRGKLTVSIGVQGVSNLNSGAGGDVYYVNDIREEWIDGYVQFIIEYYDGIKQTLRTAVVDEYSHNIAAGLTVGDGFRANITAEGKLFGIVKACSPKNDTIESSYNTGFNSVARVVKGNVEKIEDKFIKLSGRDEIFNFDNTVVYVFENNKIRKGEFREILSSENIGTGSKVFIYQKYAENKSVVIVK